MKIIIHLNPLAVAAALGINIELLKAVKTAFDKPVVVKQTGRYSVLFSHKYMMLTFLEPMDAMVHIVHPLVEALEAKERTTRSKLLLDGRPIFQVDDSRGWREIGIQVVERDGKFWLGRYTKVKTEDGSLFDPFNMWQTIGVVNGGSTNDATITSTRYDNGEPVYKVNSDRSTQLINLTDYRIFKVET